MNVTHPNIVIKCQTKNLFFSVDSQQNLLILEILHKFGHTKKLAKTDFMPFFECKEFLEGRHVGEDHETTKLTYLDPSNIDGELIQLLLDDGEFTNQDESGTT